MFGLGRLMLLNGTENEFCYAQAILNYKEDIKKLGSHLIFEQDGAPSHTSINNKKLLNKTFKKWIQNPPNSPDLAYPIENLWGILKNLRNSMRISIRATYLNPFNYSTQIQEQELKLQRLNTSG